MNEKLNILSKCEHGTKAMEKRRRECESLADICFPPNGNSQSKDLHEVFVAEYCSELVCEVNVHRFHHIPGLLGPNDSLNRNEKKSKVKLVVILLLCFIYLFISWRISFFL